MRRELLARRAERTIAELASRQRGVVARSQLAAAGLTASQIDRRLREHRLHEVHRGVYLVGHRVAPELAAEQAALLACGGAAVLSHRSAAWIWGLLRDPPEPPVCVTVGAAHGAKRPGIEIHRRRLAPKDVRRRDGLPVTSPARTILDLAAAMSMRTRPVPRRGPHRLSELEAIVAEAQYRRLVSEAELRDQVTRNRGGRGVAHLRAVLGEPGGPRRTRSSGERALLRLLRGAGIAGFETNARIHGYEVDFLWREQGVVVEVDGYDAHSGRVAFERDRLKVATLTAHGLRVLPITGRHIRDDGRGAVERIARALASSE